MNSESRADATLVGVAFGSHEGPSQSPGKIWPKQASAKDPVTLYFKGCLSVVVTWSQSTIGSLYCPRKVWDCEHHYLQ